MADSMDQHVSSTSVPDEEMAEDPAEEGDDDGEEMEDDSESSDDELEDSAIDELEAKVTASPYEYSQHVELIKLLRRVGELDRLRQANQRMSDLFPLTADLWLEWIKDETALIGSPEDRQKVTALFERAVRDYVSADVWLEYCQFCIGGTGTAEGVEKAREVFERAIAAVGLHVTRGNDIWEVYREFETALLSTMQQGDKTAADQLERVDKIFRRQLSVPLMDMEDTYKEYGNLSSEQPGLNVRQAYEKASDYLKRVTPFEEQLLREEPRTSKSYSGYFEFEKSEGKPARIQCLFERALTDDCLQAELWTQYTRYLDAELKIGDVVLPVYARAVRNCPWAVDLWQGRLIAMERYKEPHADITEVFEKALVAGFSSAAEYLPLWQTYIDYLRRRIDWSSEHDEELAQLRATLERAGEYLATYFRAEGDPTCSIQQYSARMEAKHCSNMEAARSQWNEVMTLGHGNQAQMWLDYFLLERAYGNSKHCRKILHRAIAAASDYPECLFEALLQFEREEGTLETWEGALKRIQTQTVRVSEMRAKAAREEQISGPDTQPRGGATPKPKPKQRQQDSSKLDRNSKAVKRKHPQEQAKKPVTFVASADSLKTVEGGAVFKMPPPPPPRPATVPPSQAGQQAETPPAKKPKVEELDVQSKPGVRWGPPAKEKLGHDSSKDHLTVFVKNLAYEVTEQKIRKIFAECGEISEVRMVENYRHQFRGYCYVEFKHPTSVDRALAMDRKPVEGRPMYVDHSVDKGKTAPTKSFQYEMKLEKNKLFLSGLPRSATEAQLRQVFSQHGKVVNVRVVTYRSGVPKGLAYVDFEKESDAARAVMATDNTVMDGHSISVAISNPPARKPKKEESPTSEVIETPEPPKSLGAKGVVGPRGKGRTQLSLVPRALQRSQTGASQPHGTASQQSGPAAQGTEATGGGEPDKMSNAVKMSNADFARMLLKK